MYKKYKSVSDDNEFNQYNEQNYLLDRKDIIMSILNDNINVFFQPIFNSKTKNVEYYECFIRLNHENKIILPKYFLPEIKNSKIIQLITSKVFEEIYKIISIQKMNRDNLYSFGVNLSEMDLIYSENIEYYLKLFYDKKIIDKVMFEVPSYFNLENIKDFKKELCKVNGHFALDNIDMNSELIDKTRELEPDSLKLNSIKMFDAPNSFQKFKNINKQLKGAGINTIATFVQSKKLLDMVKDSDIDSLQGYFLSPPSDSISFL